MCVQAQLEDAEGRAAKFDGLYGTVHELMQGKESVQATQDPIHSEVEAVKLQMEQHKVQVATAHVHLKSSCST